MSNIDQQDITALTSPVRSESCSQVPTEGSFMLVWLARLTQILATDVVGCDPLERSLTRGARMWAFKEYHRSNAPANVIIKDQVIANDRNSSNMH